MAWETAKKEDGNNARAPLPSGIGAVSGRKSGVCERHRRTSEQVQPRRGKRQRTQRCHADLSIGFQRTASTVRGGMSSTSDAGPASSHGVPMLVSGACPTASGACGGTGRIWLARQLPKR
ncbi:hypothetical protein LMG23994_02603 [Cupriavidus pinatubonensis]|uniref:Uncharacterized protein n=1 Tax=Cupriavidus pinatubonensis TaxID=248026 RepID=A0ABM8X0D7_9BURK|nr:hypothetical protein LMG23994_02603 [Cupriavidus pinatubonensis]